MKKNSLFILILTMALFVCTEAFCQKKFKFVNDSGYGLYGLKVKQSKKTSVWSNDIMTENEFYSGTSSTFTIPVGHSCKTYIKVTYKDSYDRIIEEMLGWADICKYSGIKILKNKKGTPGNWLTFVLLK